MPKMKISIEGESGDALAAYQKVEASQKRVERSAKAMGKSADTATKGITANAAKIGAAFSGLAVAGIATAIAKLREFDVKMQAIFTSIEKRSGDPVRRLAGINAEFNTEKRLAALAAISGDDVATIARAELSVLEKLPLSQAGRRTTAARINLAAGSIAELGGDRANVAANILRLEQRGFGGGGAKNVAGLLRDVGIQEPQLTKGLTVADELQLGPAGSVAAVSLSKQFGGRSGISILGDIRNARAKFLKANPQVDPNRIGGASFMTFLAGLPGSELRDLSTVLFQKQGLLGDIASGMEAETAKIRELRASSVDVAERTLSKVLLRNRGIEATKEREAIRQQLINAQIQRQGGIATDRGLQQERNKLLAESGFAVAGTGPVLEAMTRSLEGKVGFFSPDAEGAMIRQRTRLALQGRLNAGQTSTEQLVDLFANPQLREMAEQMGGNPDTSDANRAQLEAALALRHAVDQFINSGGLGPGPLQDKGRLRGPGDN